MIPGSDATSCCVLCGVGRRGRRKVPLQSAHYTSALSINRVRCVGMTPESKGETWSCGKLREYPSPLVAPFPKFGLDQEKG